MFDNDDDDLPPIVSMKPPANKPCSDCPFRKASAPGWLGPWDADSLLFSLGHAPFPCHQTIPSGDYKACAGMAVFLNNKCERSRHTGNAAAQDLMKSCDQEVKDSVFKNSMEFLKHHKK